MKEEPGGYRIARFIYHFGPGAWRNEAWPTRDRVVPYQLFYWLDVCLVENLLALDELHTALGVSLGYANARSGKEGKVKSAMRSARRSAYPTRTVIFNPGEE